MRRSLPGVAASLFLCALISPPTAAGAAPDTIKPVTSVTLTPGTANGSSGWYKTDVLASVTASDNVAVAEIRCMLDPVVAPSSFDAMPAGCTYAAIGANVTADGVHRLYAASRDASGNKSSVVLKQFSIDKTPPVVTAVSPARAPLATGWYTSAISWSVTGTDATSGLGSSGCPAVNYTGPDNAAATIDGFCTDRAGNKSAALTSPAFKYDATGPANVVLSVISGTSGNNGWYTSNVTVQASGFDSVSGIATCTTTTLTTDTAGRNVAGSCKNNAGLTASAPIIVIKIDKTAPAVSLSVSPDTLWPPNNQLIDVHAAVAVTDALSGSAGFFLTSVTSSDPGDDDILAFGVGAADVDGLLRAQRSGAGAGRIYTLTYTGADMAGNTATRSATVDVSHDPSAPRKAAVGLGADRLLALQRTDADWEGTWHWWVGNPASFPNLTGVTALGLLEAYRDTRDPAYLDGVRAAAAFSMTHLGSGATGIQHGIRMPAADIIVLHALARETGDAAYSTRAVSEWNNIKTFWPTAGILDSLFHSINRRLGAWDLAFYLEAAVLSGDSIWAADAAAILAETSDPFYYGEDNPWYPYIPSAALRALAGNGYAGPYQAQVQNLVEMVLDMTSDGNIAGGIQATAYGVMALRTIGGPLQNQATDMARWLTDQQARYGGWLEGDLEFPEIDGEAVRAIASTMGKNITLPGFAPRQGNGGRGRALSAPGRARAFDQ